MARSKKELRKASKHLLYEYTMFISTAAVLREAGLKSRPLVNALLESFTVHFRSLLDFFADDPHGDDVVVGQFLLPGATWTDPVAPAGVDMAAQRRRVNKEIAHLTYTRLDFKPEDDERRWPTKELVDYVKACVQRFRSGTVVDSALLHPAWKGFVEDDYERGAVEEAKGGRSAFRVSSSKTTDTATSASFTAMADMVTNRAHAQGKQAGAGAGGAEEPEET